MSFSPSNLKHSIAWAWRRFATALPMDSLFSVTGLAVANRRHGRPNVAWPRMGVFCGVMQLIALPLAAQQRAMLDFGHLDIDWTYDAGDWSVKLVWDEVFPELEVDPADGVLIAKDEPFPTEGSRTTRPTGTQWDFMGVDAGEWIWVYPSSAFGNPILEPGFATYGVPSGPGDVRINLVDVVFHGEGEAHLSVYTSASQIHMTTSNGIDGSDFYLMGRSGDHQHVSWAFTQKGVYEVSLTASMLLVANDESSRTTSDPQTLIFAVGVSDMELWLLEWGVDPGELGESDSPAGDEVPNLLKYALGLPPLTSVGSVTEPSFFEDGGEEFLALDLALNPQAQDIDVWVETSADLADWNSGIGHTVTLEQTAGRIHVRDALATGNAGRRFIRFAVERNLSEDD